MAQALNASELAALRELTKPIKKQKKMSDKMCDVLIEKGMIYELHGDIILTPKG